MSALADEYRSFRERGGIVDLASRVKLLFTGADRVRYLNGQLTANIAAAKTPSVLPACVTTAKGKLCAEIRASLSPSGILVDADAAVADTLPARLARYIIADDVTMEDTTGTLAIVHLIGTPPDSLREKFIPSNRYGIAGHDYFPPFRKDLAPVWEQLAAQFPVLSDELLELLRIERGVPRWGFELDENTLPAEAGLDRTHIDFRKGCYIGQEVISRIKSVGHANRALHGFVTRDAAPLAHGARIFTADAPDKELGRLTSTAFSFALDRHIAIGYLRRDTPHDSLLAASVEAPDAPVPVAIHSLPFIP